MELTLGDDGMVVDDRRPPGMRPPVGILRPSVRPPPPGMPPRVARRK